MTSTPVCSTCRDLGEVPVAGTYNGRITISPENLETRPCGDCGGEGTVAA